MPPAWDAQCPNTGPPGKSPGFYCNSIITSQGIWRIEEGRLGQFNDGRWPCSSTIVVILVDFLPVFSPICSNTFSIVVLIAYLQLKFFFPTLVSRSSVLHFSKLLSCSLHFL